jgi:uncharacterized protein
VRRGTSASAPRRPATRPVPSRAWAGVALALAVALAAAAPPAAVAQGGQGAPAAGAPAATPAPGTAHAAVPPAPRSWVTDTAGFLSPGAVQAIGARLADYQARTGHQVWVWITDTAGGDPIDDFAVRAFAAWKVGRAKLDDGLVFFIFARDHQIHIEVGYGLEGQVPDAIAYRIINEVMVPRLKAGDNDGGVAAGVNVALAVIDGQPWSQAFAAGGAGTAGAGAAAPDDGYGARRAPSRHPLSTLQKIMFGVIGLAFLILLVTHPSFALFLLFNILSGGRGGGGGGGGGFSGGGGGRSGGGGASGSW